MFEYFYWEAVKATASHYKCEFSHNYSDEQESFLDHAYAKFIYDYIAYVKEGNLPASWAGDVSVVINFLVRATASFPIVSFEKNLFREAVNSEGKPISVATFTPIEVRKHFNSIVSYVFAVGVLTMEMVNYFRMRGYPEPNVDALNVIKSSTVLRYVSLIEEDVKRSFLSPQARPQSRIAGQIRRFLEKNLTYANISTV